ncbi:hypothetical protein AWJ14_08910 [Hoeflea olei]|uniref:Orc1-like AAA ATPase domain-containing protein n=2 Tax=Hoeflea olei TaxID=1480615 RepID=A0A1C1Z0C1_9HYPH|nr:hypothetical protein AWJ14_08910 [Hoeflea olei]
MKFSGRGAELAALQQCWNEFSASGFSEPKTINVIGERGLGKTRLVLEFFGWLSNLHIAQGNRYWPPHLSKTGNNLELNPKLDACDFSHPIPFFWWGLRLPDVTSENAIVPSTLAAHDLYAMPHLISMSTKQKMVETRMDLVKVWGEVGIDIASNLIGLDTFLSVGGAVLSTVRIIRKEREFGQAPKRAELAGEEYADRSDTLLADLRTLFSPKSLGYSGTPGIIFIDDAQFLKSDPFFQQFVERLTRTVRAEKWPLLIINTHWQREYNLVTSAPAPDQPPPGDDAVVDIFLKPNFELVATLVDEFPGLEDEQVQQIIGKTGGNARYLEQIIKLLQTKRSYFVERDLQKPLTEAGLAKLMGQSFHIHEVVMARLMDESVPESVREAICIASIQGITFSTHLAKEIARHFLKDECDRAFLEAETPTAVLTTNGQADAHTGHFSERLFYEAAVEIRDELERIPEGTDGLTGMMCDLLVRRLRLPFAQSAHSLDENEHLLNLALEVMNAELATEELESLRLVALARRLRVDVYRYNLTSAKLKVMELIEESRKHPGLALDVESLSDCLSFFYKDKKANEFEVSLALQSLMASELQRLSDMGRDESIVNHILETIYASHYLIVTRSDFNRLDPTDSGFLELAEKRIHACLLFCQLHLLLIKTSKANDKKPPYLRDAWLELAKATVAMSKVVYPAAAATEDPPSAETSPVEPSEGVEVEPEEEERLMRLCIASFDFLDKNCKGWTES